MDTGFQPLTGNDSTPHTEATFYAASDNGADDDYFSMMDGVMPDDGSQAMLDDFSMDMVRPGGGAIIV